MVEISYASPGIAYYDNLIWLHLLIAFDSEKCVSFDPRKLWIEYMYKSNDDTVVFVSSLEDFRRMMVRVDQ